MQHFGWGCKWLFDYSEIIFICHSSADLGGKIWKKNFDERERFFGAKDMGLIKTTFF